MYNVSNSAFGRPAGRQAPVTLGNAPKGTYPLGEAWRRWEDVLSVASCYAEFSFDIFLLDNKDKFVPFALLLLK